MALRLLRLFLHRQDAIRLVNLHHAAFPELFHVVLAVTHNATGLFVQSISDKPRQGKIEHVIPGDHKQIILQAELINSELDISDRAEPGFIRACPVIDDSDVLSFAPRPMLKLTCEFCILRVQMFG